MNHPKKSSFFSKLKLPKSKKIKEKEKLLKMANKVIEQHQKNTAKAKQVEKLIDEIRNGNDKGIFFLSEIVVKEKDELARYAALSGIIQLGKEGNPFAERVLNNLPDQIKKQEKK